MSLTESKVIDQIIVTEDGTILYRETTRITRDGEQIAKTYHRISVPPGGSLEDCPPNVSAIAQVVWTPDVIDAYKSRRSGDADDSIAMAI